jgi:hypothetical protein
MPRHKWRVDFPQAITGRWLGESPVGVRVFEESFENASSASKEMSTGSFSAYILVDSGLRSSGIGKTALTQSVYFTVTPGSSVEHSNKLRESSVVSTASGVLRDLSNKIRAVVIVSVG